MTDDQDSRPFAISNLCCTTESGPDPETWIVLFENFPGLAFWAATGRFTCSGGPSVSISSPSFWEARKSALRCCRLNRQRPAGIDARPGRGAGHQSPIRSGRVAGGLNTATASTLTPAPLPWEHRQARCGSSKRDESCFPVLPSLRDGHLHPCRPAPRRGRARPVVSSNSTALVNSIEG